MNTSDKQVRISLTKRLAAHAAGARQAAVFAHAFACRVTAELLARASAAPAGGRFHSLAAAAAQSAPLRSFRKEPRFWISLAVVIAALLSSVATFLIINNLTFLFPSNDVVLGTLGISAAFVLAIIGIIGFQIVKLL